MTTKLSAAQRTALKISFGGLLGTVTVKSQKRISKWTMDNRHARQTQITHATANSLRKRRLFEQVGPRTYRITAKGREALFRKASA